MQKKHIWITGAAGFLGGHTGYLFANNGWAVSSIDIAPVTHNQFSSFASINNVLDRRTLDHLLTLSKPDCIFHAAGSGAVGDSIANPDLDFHNSVTNTQMILDFIREKSPETLFVLPSSAGVYGASDQQPLSENHPLNPVSPYGKHKAMAEEVCRKASEIHKTQTVVIRFFSLYGPRLFKQLLWDVGCKALKSNKEIQLFGTGQETRDMLYVEDATSIIKTLVEQKNPGHILVNGGTGYALSVKDIASGLLKALGLDLAITFNNEVRPGDPAHYQADLTYARKLGYTPQTKFSDGIQHYAKWFQQVKQLEH
ncbi:NAD-dependent epimerase/dehydratase family protein [Curvivirga aplysinae]|uniref:NAD-dependent epimerase/dehydratase family protein n=1 Tax=Curvivirga aplysinae TaxID=2529852 RepID=UPI0012BD72C6|nr:NAD-dependent epimerase/dehydratase family protein [Curvivirga aplysinae]